jgi:preprotein translocase subunit YajC
MSSAHAVVTALMAAPSSSKKSGNALVSLLPLILIFGLAYVFFLRPRSQAARRQRETLMELTAGDEVLTGSGIFGRVLDVEDDRVTIETAPGTRLTVLRSTIARKLTPVEEEEDGWRDEEREGAGWEDHDHDHDHAEDDHDHDADDDHGPEAEHRGPGEHPASGGEHGEDRTASGEDHKP